jgi:hypothetical protein
MSREACLVMCFAIVVSAGWKNTQRTTREPSAPLTGFQATVTGRFWVPADNVDQQQPCHGRALACIGSFSTPGEIVQLLMPCVPRG